MSAFYNLCFFTGRFLIYSCTPPPNFNCTNWHHRKISSIKRYSTWFPYKTCLTFSFIINISYITSKWNLCRVSCSQIPVIISPFSMGIDWFSICIKSCDFIPTDCKSCNISTCMFQIQSSTLIHSRCSNNIFCFSVIVFSVYILSVSSSFDYLKWAVTK